MQQNADLTRSGFRFSGCHDDLLMRAKAFAAHYHRGQVRKYTGEPYIVHCAEVADLVASAGLPTEAVAAAWLHDTVEDTDATLPMIGREFGPAVYEHVFFLTDASKPSDGNRAARKAIDRQHIASAPPLTKSIKVADLISNTRTITKYDPDFSKVYMKEKAKVLLFLSEADPFLYRQALKIVFEYKFGNLD